MKATGMVESTIYHCEALDGMIERVGGVMGWMGRLGGGDSWL